MATNNQDGRFGAIADQQGIVIQTRFDLKDMYNRLKADSSSHYIYPGRPATNNNAVVRTDVNDLVYRVASSKANKASILNNAIEGTTYTNGLAIGKNKTYAKTTANPENPAEKEIYERQVHQILSEGIRFLGIALGPTNPNPEQAEHSKLQFTTRVHGTCHILNTSTETIVPGDVLLYDFFTTKEIESPDFSKRFSRYGYSDEKIPLKLVKLEDTHFSLQDMMLPELRARASDDASMMATAPAMYLNGLIDLLVKLTAAMDPQFDATGSEISRAVEMTKKKKPMEFQDGEEEKYNYIKALMERFRDLFSDATYPGYFEKCLREFYIAQTYLVNDLERRKVGKALSFAKSGKGLDVLLGAM